MAIKGYTEIAIVVSDLKKAKAFYGDLLKMTTYETLAKRLH